MASAYPRSVPIATVEELSVAIADFGFPFVLKPTVSWTAERRERALPVEVIDKDEAADAAEDFLARRARPSWRSNGCLAGAKG